MLLRTGSWLPLMGDAALDTGWRQGRSTEDMILNQSINQSILLAAKNSYKNINLKDKGCPSLLKSTTF